VPSGKQGKPESKNSTRKQLTCRVIPDNFTEFNWIFNCSLEMKDLKHLRAMKNLFFCLQSNKVFFRNQFISAKTFVPSILLFWHFLATLSKNKSFFFPHQKSKS
jgi:hypothetical protein